MKSKEILEAGDPILGSSDLPMTDPRIEPDELDFSPSLPKSRTKHLSLFKSRSCVSVNEGGLSGVKHHTSFTEEYDVFSKELTKNIEEECLSAGQSKKIIGLKKIDSGGIQFIENKDFSEEKLNPEGGEGNKN